MFAQSIRSWPRFAFILLAVAGVSNFHASAALTVAFSLNNITYSNTAFPFAVTTGSGLIAWTFNAGDFQNGAGKYVFVNLPPNTVPPAGVYGPVYTTDAVSVTGTITQNVDCYWYDWSISFSPALASPNSTAQIAGGSYNLASGSCQDFLGQVLGGTVTPYKPALSVQESGTNVVVSWPTNYADGFILESANSLKLGSLWATSSIPEQVLGANYVVTNGLAKGTNVFFRLIR